MLRTCLIVVAALTVLPSTPHAQVASADDAEIAMQQVLDGLVEFVAKVPDRNDLGMKFTPEASAMLNAMTCEQRQLYADTLGKTWSVLTADPHATVALWTGGNPVFAGDGGPERGNVTIIPCPSPRDSQE